MSDDKPNVPMLGLVSTVAFNEPARPLGIRYISFERDGTITAAMEDGSVRPVHLPSGWKAQAFYNTIIYECPCGEFVVGVPSHNCQ